MSDTLSIQPTQTLPDAMLSNENIEALAIKAGLSPIEATMVRSVRGAIQYAARNNDPTLLFALGMEDGYKPINLQQLDLMVNTPELRTRITNSDAAIEACRKLIKHHRQIWLDHGTLLHYCEQMGLILDVVTAVLNVVYPVGLALENDDDEILDVLRAKLCKPPLRDVVGRHIVISHSMLDGLFDENPTSEALRRKLFGSQPSMKFGRDVHTTKAFLTRLMREMT